MEALILVLLAFLIVVYLEAAYWIIALLLRWAPMIAAGVLAGLIARHSGVGVLEALGIGILA